MALTGGNSDRVAGSSPPRVGRHALEPAADPGIPDHRSATRYLVCCRWHPFLFGSASCSASSGWSRQALMPAAIGKAIDAGVTDRDTGALLPWAAVLLGLGRGPGGRRHPAAPLRGLQLAGRRLPHRAGHRAARRTGSARRCPSGWPPARWSASAPPTSATSATRIDITARGTGARRRDRHGRGDPARRLGAARPGGGARRAGADGDRRRC